MPKTSARHILVYITAPSPEQAGVLAETLVRERLVAGANVIASVCSHYWWDGAMQSAAESLCLCKTTMDRFEAVEKRVRALHPYKVPCIIALPIAAGFPPFLEWIERETDPS